MFNQRIFVSWFHSLKGPWFCFRFLDIDPILPNLPKQRTLSAHGIWHLASLCESFGFFSYTSNPRSTAYVVFSSGVSLPLALPVFPLHLAFPFPLPFSGSCSCCGSRST